jgi:hypothetical protein
MIRGTSQLAGSAAAMLLNALLTLWPSSVTATMQITAIKPTRRPYFDERSARPIRTEAIDQLRHMKIL